MKEAIAGIEKELDERLRELENAGKLLEAQRLRMRTTYDIEMMQQMGFCSVSKTIPGILTAVVQAPHLQHCWTTFRMISHHH